LASDRVIRHLTLADVVYVIERAIGAPPVVRDWGLLESAVARPATVLFDHAIYPTLAEKAAALMHSLASNHALLDGNKRAGFACAAVFCHINGHPLTMTQHDAYELTMRVARGELSDVKDIADQLK